MNGSASMKSAATDGRFLLVAFKDECTSAKAKRSEPELSTGPQAHKGPKA
jgi:hypothetical protein